MAGSATCASIPTVRIDAIATTPNAPSIFTLAMLYFHFMDYWQILKDAKTLQDGHGDVKHFIVKTGAVPFQKKARIERGQASTMA